MEILILYKFFAVSSSPHSDCAIARASEDLAVIAEEFCRIDTIVMAADYFYIYLEKEDDQ